MFRGARKVASVDIREAVVTKGALPCALLHRVLGWCVSHTEELLADWELSRRGEELKWIDWTID